MKRLVCVFGIAVLLVFGSCTKKAAVVIVGQWRIDGIYNNHTNDYSIDFQQSTVFEFNSDGMVRFVSDGHVYEGSYIVKGPDIELSYDHDDGRPIIAKITSMNDDAMQWITSDKTMLSFSRIR